MKTIATYKNITVSWIAQKRARSKLVRVSERLLALSPRGFPLAAAAGFLAPTFELASVSPAPEIRVNART